MLNLLTMKPFIYGLNKRSGGGNLDETDPEVFKNITDHIKEKDSSFVVIDAKIEDELKDFEGEEKELMRGEIAGGVSEDGIIELIHEGYKMLGLETYFTTGEDETRGWTIKKNSTAPVAAAAIHTDFQNKFIRAEVVACSDLLSAGSYKVAREKGLVRTEGKEYMVKDGDVIEFRI